LLATGAGLQETCVREVIIESSSRKSRRNIDKRTILLTRRFNLEKFFEQHGVSPQHGDGCAQQFGIFRVTQPCDVGAPSDGT